MEDHSFGHDTVLPGELEDIPPFQLGTLPGHFALRQRAQMAGEAQKLQSDNARLQRGFNTLRLHLKSLEDMCERMGQGGEA